MLKKTIVSALVISSLVLGSAQASQEEASRETLIGLGAGAVAGALVGGPIGLGVGAILGAVVGDNVHITEEMAASDARHLAEISSLEGELAVLRQHNGSLAAERQRLSRELTQLAELRESRVVEGSLSTDVLFRTGSAELEPVASARLAELGQALQSFPNLRIRLEGHADMRGKAEDNLRLSAERTEAVKQALVAAGVPLERIETVPLGETKARASVDDADGLALDRRVAIELELTPVAEPEHAVSATF